MQGNKKLSGRIHYRSNFREKIFGVRNYKYSLNVEGSLSLVLFKERNICFRASLVNQHGKVVFHGNLFFIIENALSINLKVYYSNGEEIGQTKKGEDFIKGTVNSTMIRG